MSIGVYCPSRGRPALAKRMYESVRDTSNAEVFFYVCEDQKQQYERADLIGPDISLIWKFNLLAERFPRPFMMMATDDMTFETKGWDERVRGAFPEDRIACVCGHDGRDDRSRTFWTVSLEWTEVLGYFMPPWFMTFYSDSWVSELAAEAGRLVYLPDLIFRHEKIMDETRKSMRTGANAWVSARDRDLRRRMQAEFVRDAQKLKEAADVLR